MSTFPTTEYGMLDDLLHGPCSMNRRDIPCRDNKMKLRQGNIRCKAIMMVV